MPKEKVNSGTNKRVKHERKTKTVAKKRMLASVVDIQEDESSRVLVSRHGNLKNQSPCFGKRMIEKSKKPKRFKLNKTVADIKAKNEMLIPNKHKYYMRAINKFLSTGIVDTITKMKGLYLVERQLFSDKFFAAALEWYFYKNKQEDGVTQISWGQMKNFRGYLGATLAMKKRT